MSNRSSGRMGYALAEAARDAGHEVLLVSGPVCLPPPGGITLVPVTTADQMYAAVFARLDGVALVVMAAAVADFKPVAVAPHKLKKSGGIPKIELEPTRDILAALGAVAGRSYRLVGFAAETEHLLERAWEKLRRKGCDCVVANDVSGAESGFEVEENRVTACYSDGTVHEFPRAEKKALARELVGEWDRRWKIF